MRNILVTGGAGFIGSAFVRHMVRTYPQYNIITFDKMTYAGNLDNLIAVQSAPNHAFVQGDIADREAVGDALERHHIDTIVNFAAETHVDRSILDPDAFLRTNVFGVYILLEVGRTYNIERFLHVSTDEVYGDVEHGFSTEEDRFLPNSPYASAKAGGELMVRSYHVTYGMDTVITRGSNTYGIYHYPEKIIPLFITEALEDRPLPVYGDGLQIRDWLYVDDHARGVDVVLHHGISGEAYNLAGEDLHHNIDLVKQLLRLLNKPETLIKYVPDRPGHDRRYAMSAEKARALGWERTYTLEKGLAETVAWYQANEWWWRKIKTGEYLEYYRKQYAERLNAAVSEQ